MELFFVILIVAVVWWAIKKNKKTEQFAYIPKKAATPQPEVPEIKVTFTSSVGGGRRGNAKEAQVGALVEDGAGGWVLNPNAPLTLTVTGGDRQLAQQLREVLDSSEYWSQKIPDVALLIAQHNIRFKEVDEFLGTYRKRFETDVSRQIHQPVHGGGRQSDRFSSSCKAG